MLHGGEKIAIVIFLLINPIVFHVDPFLAGWLLVVEFIFTLAMALKRYPLQSRWPAGHRGRAHRHDLGEPDQA